MKTVRSSLVCVTLLFFAASAFAQNSPATATSPTMALPDWFLGSWDVSYQDSLLQTVRASVNVSAPNGIPSVRYVVTDPRNGAQTDLWAFTIRVNGNEITMELPPGGPSAILGPNDNLAPAGPGAEVIRAPAGARLSATLSGSRVDAPVNPVFSRSSTRLRLTRTGATLIGEWTTARDTLTGFQGARSGLRGTIVRSAPPPLGDLTVPAMHGEERWSPLHMIVERADRIKWITATSADAGKFEGTATVLIEGRNLPVGFRQKAEVHFSDPYLQAVNAELQRGPGESSIIVPVRLDRRAIPGAKTFTLKETNSPNETTGTWFFDWPALDVKAIYHARQVREGEYEPTGVLTGGEHFYVEAETRELETGRRSIGDHRFYTMETEEQKPIGFHLVRDPERPAFYRAGPFLLLGRAETPPAGSKAITPELSPNQTSVITPKPDRPFLMHANVGDQIISSPASKGNDDVLVAAVAGVEAIEEDGPYQRALRQAEDIRRRHPEKERYDITRYEPGKVIAEVLRIALVPSLPGSTPPSPKNTDPDHVSGPLLPGAVRRTYVTVADHAALLLLHAEMSHRMGEAMRRQMKVMTPAELHAFEREVFASATGGKEEPLFEQKVPTADGKDEVALSIALDSRRLDTAFGGRAAERAAYVDRIYLAACNSLAGKLGGATMRVDSVDVTKPSELLPIVKLAYSTVVGSVLQHMVRRPQPPVGANGPRWVSDETGRAAVRGIEDLLGAIAADEELASAEINYAALVTLPLSLFAVPALTARGMATGALLFTRATEAAMFAGSVANVLHWDDLSRQARFADNAAPVVGPELRHVLSDEANMAMAGMVADVVVPLTFEAAGRVFRAAPSVAENTMNYAVTRAMRQGAENLPNELREPLLYAAGRAAKRAAEKGVESLSEMDRNALRVLYPEGLPSDLAHQLKIPPGSPDFAVRSESSASGNTMKFEQPDFPTVADTKVGTAPRRVAPPESSSSALIRKLYNETEDLARGGGIGAAQARFAKLERAAADWEKLPVAAQRRVNEAVDMFAELRTRNPALASIEDADALAHFNLHADASIAVTSKGGTRDIDPADLVADLIAYSGKDVSAADLARAGRTSIPNAEAAMFEAAARHPRNTIPHVADYTPARVRDPNGITVDVYGKTVDELPSGVDVNGTTVHEPGPARAPVDVNAPTAREAHVLDVNAPTAREAHVLDVNAPTAREPSPVRAPVDVTAPTRREPALLPDVTAKTAIVPHQPGVAQPAPAAAQPAREFGLDPGGGAPPLARPVTVDVPAPSGVVLPHNNPRRIEIAKRLEGLGLSPADADFAAIIPAGRPGSPEANAAAVAFERGIPPERVMSEFKMSRAELEAKLDAYLREFNPSTTDVERRRMFSRYFNDDPTAVHPVGNAPAVSRARPALPEIRPGTHFEPIINDARGAAIAERLQRMGVPPEDAAFAGVVAGSRPGSIENNAAAAAFNRGVPAQRMMDELHLTRPELEARLDAHLREFDASTPAQRRQVIDRYFANTGPIVEPRPPAATRSPSEADLPRGLDQPKPSPAQAAQDVSATLNRMGVPPHITQQLKPEEIFPRAGAQPRDVAAGLSSRFHVDARFAARELGVSDTEFAGMLDRYNAATRPELSASSRAAEVADRLTADGVTNSYGRVLAARQAQTDAALRDVGITRGDPTLTARGVNPESAVVGEALSRGVSADDVAARRGLTKEQVNYYADDYLLNGRGVTDTAERARQRTELLRPAASSGGGRTPTVKIPPQVIAAQYEIDEALQRLGVDPAQAAQRAEDLANLGRDNAHEAIVVGAWQSRVSPADLRRQFGLTDGQIAQGLDHYLEHYVGMKNPDNRARYISEQMFGRAGQSVKPEDVRAMLKVPQSPPPLRAHTTATPPPLAAGAPPPRAAPLPEYRPLATASVSDAIIREREVVGGLMRREWDRILARRDAANVSGHLESSAASVEYKRRFPSTEADHDRFGDTIGTIARSADGKTLVVTRAHISPDARVSAPLVQRIPITDAPVDFNLEPGQSTSFVYTNVSLEGG